MWRRTFQCYRDLGLTLLTLAAAGCGDVMSKVDAGVPRDAADAGIDLDSTTRRCDPNKPFAAPQPLSISTTAYEEGASLSPDELTIYFTSDRGGPGSVGDFDVFVATRQSITAAFGPASVLAGVNTVGRESWAAITADGRFLYVDQYFVGASGWDLYVAQRANTSVDFGPLAVVPSLNSAGGISDANQFIMGDNSAIYFASTRPANADNNIYRATRNVGGTFDTPQPLGINTTTYSENTVAVTADELTIFFSSDDPSGQGANDIYMAKRTTISDGFGMPQRQAVLSSNLNEHVNWLSPDGCNIYLMKEVAPGATYDIYQASRPM